MESSRILEKLKKKGIYEETDKEMLVIAKKEKYVVRKDLMLKWLRDKSPGANGSGSEVTLGELYLLEELLLFTLKVLDDSRDGFTEGLEAELANLRSKGVNASFASGGCGSYNTLEQRDVENANHGNAQDKIQCSPGSIWVLNIFPLTLRTR